MVRALAGVLHSGYRARFAMATTEIPNRPPLIDWPEEGVARAPYRVFRDREIYEAEQQRIFRGPIWNYLALEVEIPDPG